MPRARSRRVINRASSIIIAGAGERYVSSERRTHTRSIILFLSIHLPFSQNHSRGHSRNIGGETFVIAHRASKRFATRDRLSIVKTRPGAFPWIKSQQFYTPSCFLPLSSISSHAKNIIYNSSVMCTPGGDFAQLPSLAPARVHGALHT